MILAALVATGAGFTAWAGGILAQTAGGDTAVDLAPWISGGGAITAVGALAYIARLMANGGLVSRDVATHVEQLKELLDESLDRERKLEKCVEAGAERERSYHSLLVERYEAFSGRRVPRKDEDG